MLTSKKSLRLILVFICLTALIPLNVMAVHGQTTGSVQIHSVMLQPVEGQLAHKVEAFISVLDADGLPVKELSKDQIQLLEDGQNINVEQFTVAPSIPLNLILAIDTSGSMRGPAIQQSKEAAGKFITSLSLDDSTALIAFNQEVNTLNDFSQDHDALLKQVELIKAVPNSGTCLYDALYQSVQLISQTQPGRRAILVLTDGRDELYVGKVCSTVKVDDVIAAALAQSAPIYTIGLGSQVDEKDLGRMAMLTGGEYLHSPDPNQLSALFKVLFDHIRYQYYLSYTSNTVPGLHTLSMNVAYKGSNYQDSKDFMTPEFAPIISIEYPLPGDTLHLPIDISTKILGQKEKVDSVRFENGTATLGVDGDEPFSFSIPEAAIAPGETELRVIALDKAGFELSRDSVIINISELPVEETSKPTSDIVVTPQPNNTVQTTKRNLLPLIIIGLGVLGVLIAAIILFLQNRKKRKSDNAKNPEGYSADATMVIDNNRRVDDNATEVFSPVAQAQPKTLLTILFSDDALRIGEQVEIKETPVRLGRAIDNDLVLPKDHPVSRRHAMIDLIDGNYIFEEVTSESRDDATLKYPTYGTYINGRKLIPGEKVTLKNGDEIQLGPRLRLRFDHNQRKENLSDLTIDDFRMP